MTETFAAERGYRRCLRCYPRSFRREHEEEILAVLLATTGDAQGQADRRECVALLRSALGIRLRPRIAHSDRSRLAAVKLMYLGAAAELLVGITVMATMPNLRSRVVARNPAYSARQWHAEVASSLHPLIVSAAIGTVLWLWLAWATGRQHRLARIAFLLFFLLTTYSLANGLRHGSATYAPTDLAAGSLLWLIQLSAVRLLFHDSGQAIRRLPSQCSRFMRRKVTGKAVVALRGGRPRA
jgi:hypothetical protein